MQHSMCYNSHFIDADSEFHSMPGLCENARFLRKQFMVENEQALELERRHLSEMHLAAKPLSHHFYYGYPMDEFKHPEDHAEQAEFPSAKEFTYLLDVLNNGSTSEGKIGHINGNYNDQDSSQGINLPESPFASPIVSGISTVM
ncbi:zinc finger CCCH domain-containing protein 18 isoform X1 [Prunus yedoensis var. nudiflora]|uniref:Zinc finger CCCH domain-containing protein 18 isoform X1 n=1 Tax=Prunus yedoensis var. nudiflora TaxID=2094558 RepID=A0A314YHY3_PRUYE|nr:zinc finger CCCH domain-containing protein 18 isoform X1 [Prunus yedoensis var. nudiflora]